MADHRLDFLPQMQTPEEYLQQFKDKSNFSKSKFHGYAYDGIWALASAMQTIEEQLRPTNQNLTDFEYK